MCVLAEAVIFVAPVIAPDICKLLPPTIVVPTFNASPTKVFFLTLSLK